MRKWKSFWLVFISPFFWLLLQFSWNWNEHTVVTMQLPEVCSIEVNLAKPVERRLWRLLFKVKVNIAVGFFFISPGIPPPPAPPMAPPPAPGSKSKRKLPIVPSAPLPMLNWIPIHSAGKTVFKVKLLILIWSRASATLLTVGAKHPEGFNLYNLRDKWQKCTLNVYYNMNNSIFVIKGTISRDLMVNTPYTFSDTNTAKITKVIFWINKTPP